MRLIKNLDQKLEKLVQELPWRTLGITKDRQAPKILAELLLAVYRIKNWSS